MPTLYHDLYPRRKLTNRLTSLTLDRLTVKGPNQVGASFLLLSTMLERRRHARGSRGESARRGRASEGSYKSTAPCGWQRELDDPLSWMATSPTLGRKTLRAALG